MALPFEPVYVRGDPARLVQIFATLLGSASRSTSPRSEISVAVIVCSPNLTITVSNVGFEPRHQPRPLDGPVADEPEPAFRDARTRLDLARLNELIQAQGGTISATSCHGDHGTAITVTLALDDSAPQGG